MIINILTFLVILFLTFINGLTDATNAISTVVGSKVLNYRKACILSAIFEFLGVIIMSMINNSVMDCISKIAVLSNDMQGLITLCVGMIATIAFSVVATLFGIPTSESHGLIAGITGAAIYTGGIKSINMNEWMDVIIGLVWSIIRNNYINKSYIFVYSWLFKKIEC